MNERIRELAEHKDPQGCWCIRCQLGKVYKNTAPPKREWVGLTDEEMVKDMKDNCDSYEMRGAFVNGWKSAEVKLKEKNT